MIDTILQKNITGLLVTFGDRQETYTTLKDTEHKHCRVVTGTIKLVGWERTYYNHLQKELFKMMISSNGFCERSSPLRVNFLDKVVKFQSV